MNVIKSVKNVIYLTFLFCISCVFAVLTGLNLIYLMIVKGPGVMFKRSKRDAPPSCLSDASLGNHGYLHLEHVVLHYVAAGSEDKPLMLLLHGFPECWYSWRHQLRAFSGEYRVVALDMRGYGGSSAPNGISEYQLDRMVADVRQAITALGYSSCVLCGHDWGGAVTWALAGAYPDMVDKAIVFNCPHPRAFYKYIYSHVAQFRKSWYMFFFLLPVIPEIYISLSDMKFFDIIFKGKKGGVLTSATTQEDVEAYKYNFRKWSSLTAPINYIRAGLLYKPSSRMGQKVTRPMLLVWGTRDLALETGLTEYCREFSYSLTVRLIEGASHWVQMDRPEEVNALVKEFLEK